MYFSGKTLQNITCERIIVVEHPFGMPLHKQEKRPLARGLPLECFDNSLRRLRNDTKSLPYGINSLMMGAIHFSRLAPDNFA